MRDHLLAFSWKARRRSLEYAGAGIWQLLKTEHNAWIHLAFTLLVAVASICFHISRLEAGMLFFAIVLVWVAEMINTCIERTLNFITQKRYEEIRIIKDMAAGAVLLASITAALIGCLIFIPKILDYVH